MRKRNTREVVGEEEEDAGLMSRERFGKLGGFFFKQKTAYEMRISDWSSDVCSSDLCSYWPRLTTATGMLAPPNSCSSQSAGSMRIARHGPWASSRKIGRASCRERVCQYV